MALSSPTEQFRVPLAIKIQSECLQDDQPVKWTLNQALTPPPPPPPQSESLWVERDHALYTLYATMLKHSLWDKK